MDRRVGWRLAGVITRSSRYTDPLLLQGELTEQGKEKWTGELAGVITRSSRYTDPLLLQGELTEQGREKWTGELAGGYTPAGGAGPSNNSIIQIYRPASSSRRTNRTRKGEGTQRKRSKGGGGGRRTPHS